MTIHAFESVKISKVLEINVPTSYVGLIPTDIYNECIYLKLTLEKLLMALVVVPLEYIMFIMIIMKCTI